VKREQGLLVGVVVLLGLMSWGLMTREGFSKGPRGPRTLSVELEAMREGELVVALNTPESDPRDAMVKPQADFPLPPLSLPTPPLPALPVLLPPPLPDSGANQWSQSLYRYPAMPVGDLDDLIDPSSVDLGPIDVEEEGEEASFDVEGGVDDPSANYAALYDSVKLDALRTVWGFILNDDRYDRSNGDTLRFQQVRPETGEELFAPREFAADEYQSFSFADTLRNRIELQYRELRRVGAGRTNELRASIMEMLDDAMQEPVAFGYADDLARHLIQLAEDDPDNWLALGEVWERTFRFDEAFTLYARLAGETLPSNAPDLGMTIADGKFSSLAAMRLGMSRILRRVGMDGDAEDLLRRAVRLQPGNEDALHALGTLLLDTGALAEAIETLERVAELPLPRGGALPLANAQSLGRAYLAAGRFDDASKIFADSARAAGQQLAGGVSRLGGIAAAYLSGEFGTALQLAEESIELDGVSPELLYMRALATAADGGAAAEVVRDLRAAADAAPLDAAPALAALAFWLDVLGDSNTANETLARCLELDPELPYGRYLLARWSARDGQTAAASTVLRGLVADSPRCAGALVELGWLLHEDEAFEAAEVAFRRAELSRPKDLNDAEHAAPWADLALRRGINQMQLSKWEQAADLLAEALSLQPSLYAAQNARAAVAYAQGDLTQAVSEFGFLIDDLREQEEHPQLVFAGTWQARIQKRARLRLWEDSFEGNRLRPGWDVQTHARTGVGPELRNGALTIRGTHDTAGYTRASRQAIALHFESFAGDVQVGEAHRGDAGAYIALETRQGTQTWFFNVFRDRDGQLVYHTKQGAKEDRQRLTTRVPAGTPMRVSFELDREPSTPELTVRVNEEVVYTGSAAVLKSAAGTLVYGVFADTANALPVDVTLDNVSVVYAQP